MDTKFMLAFEIGYADFLRKVLTTQLREIENALKQGFSDNDEFMQRIESLCRETSIEMPLGEEVKELIDFSTKIFRRKIYEAVSEVSQYCKLVVRADEET